MHKQDLAILQRAGFLLAIKYLRKYIFFARSFLRRTYLLISVVLPYRTSHVIIERGLQKVERDQGSLPSRVEAISHGGKRLFAFREYWLTRAWRYEIGPGYSLFRSRDGSTSGDLSTLLARRVRTILRRGRRTASGENSTRNTCRMLSEHREESCSIGHLTVPDNCF